MQRTRAIIVDDEPITCIDLCDMLQNLGFVVEGSAADGFDAIELCRRHHPDLVLMDIKMPVFDGLTAARTIMEEDLAGCIVLLTAYPDEDFIQRAIDIGVCGYLVKPVDEKRLLPGIQLALAQAEHLRRMKADADQSRQDAENIKLVERAKAVLAKQRGISEGDAYRQIQKLAMDKHRTMAEIARALLEQDSPRELVNRAKERLMRSQGLSEQAAYHRLKAMAQSAGGDLAAVARRVLSEKPARTRGR